MRGQSRKINRNIRNMLLVIAITVVRRRELNHPVIASLQNQTWRCLLAEERTHQLDRSPPQFPLVPNVILHHVAFHQMRVGLCADFRFNHRLLDHLVFLAALKMGTVFFKIVRVWLSYIIGEETIRILKNQRESKFSRSDDKLKCRKNWRCDKLF